MEENNGNIKGTETPVCGPKKDTKRRFINWTGILLFLSIVGPGIITANVDNDAGGIATFSLSGANFGYSMLWALIPITISLVVVQEMCARMGVVTGKGLSDLIREEFGIKVTFFIMIGLIFANIATTISEFAGIAAASEIFGISKYITVPICVLVIIFIIIKFDYKKVERVFFFLVFFYLAYVFSGIMAHPDWGEVARETLVPSFKFSSYYLVVLIALIGTNITPWMQFYLQASVVEKGIKISEYKYAKWDVILGCISTDIITFFVIVAVATTIFKAGFHIETAADAARALMPLAGKYAGMLFAFGLFNAAFFGACILPMSTSFYVCESFGWESGMNRKFKEAKMFYGIIIFTLLLSAGLILIPNIPLLNIMLFSQVINGVLLPFILIYILLLINNKKIMGSHTNTRTYNIIAWATVVILILLTILMVITTIWPGFFASLGLPN
jgi:NRAMP (natural resistance-associated macrophage protein)-like metal ion transporter